MKVYADETANAVEEEIPHNPQPAPPLGKLTRNDVLQCYSIVFRPGRGNPPGTLMHTELDPNVRPGPAQVRPVPVARLDKVNEELERLSNEGIMKPVTQPTDRLSNILVKEKPHGKIRICIDPSQTINRAIRRPQYTIPAIEEKLPLLTNAKVFTMVKSAPYYSRGNRKSESAVKIAKNILKKSRKEDPYLALLAYTNTPKQGCNYSPAQRLMSRRLEDIIPTAQH